MSTQTSGAAPLNLEQEFLALTHRNLLRNPIPVLVGMGVIAVAAWGSVPPNWVVGWLLISCFGVIGRAFVIRRVLRGVYSDQHKLRVIYFLNFINAIILCSSMMFFPTMGVIDAVLLTLVLGFLSMGVVITNAGFTKASMPYISMVLVTLAVMWTMFPHTEGDGELKAYVLSAFIVFMNIALLSVSKDINRLFRGSVEMRQKYTDINSRLTESLGEAQAANAAKTRFLAAASHDLRQPVHTLSLLTAALISRNKSGSTHDDAVSEITNTMDKALSSLAVQLDSLLDISKLDAGVVTPQIENIDITPIVSHLQSEFSSLANEKKLSINLTAPKFAMALTDATLLERLLRNLFANAIKYTEVGGVDITVSCDDELIISVKDTGIGIAEDQHKLVFEEFYQIDNPHRDRGKGLGLGLSIVTRLCALLDIKLTLESGVDQGTNFLLRLNKGDQIPVEEADEDNSSNVFNGLKVLVLDDDTSILLASKVYLESQGCVVFLAETIVDAINVAQTESLELAIVDMRLRNHENGIDALHAIRTLCPSIPALMITGDTAPDRLKEAAQVNAKLLHKPIHSDQLRLAIKEVVEATSLEHV
jgi:signal transduction histidine kinase/CheY-like chemotaxis protein